MQSSVTSFIRVSLFQHKTNPYVTARTAALLSALLYSMLDVQLLLVLQCVPWRKQSERRKLQSDVTGCCGNASMT